MNTIITIGRQYGSGGKEIGKKLSEHYGIPFYDKELLKIAAKESGICEEMFESFDEKPTNSYKNPERKTGSPISGLFSGAAEKAAEPASDKASEPAKAQTQKEDDPFDEIFKIFNN